MIYKIEDRLSLPTEANTRYCNLTTKESEKGGRIIGGDKGDLRFNGFYLENGETVLDSPELITNDNLTPDQVYDIANEVLMASFESIGTETVEHS